VSTRDSTVRSAKRVADVDFDLFRFVFSALTSVLDDDDVCVAPTPALIFCFLSFLSMDRIVGGSCSGSPANINFFALNMGIQQTCYNVSVFSMSPPSRYITASKACVASSISTTSKSWYRSWRPPEEWHVAKTIWFYESNRDKIREKVKVIIVTT
jgi:hypothetical protein